jgi:hypothetical protein
MKRIFLFAFLILFSTNGALLAQQPAPEVTVTLNEQFLNTFLDAVFTNLETPTFRLAETKQQSAAQKVKYVKNECVETITLLREMNGVRTAVKFVDGKIITPLAFTGNYDFPFVGCSTFKGWAEADLNLEYDRSRGVLFGRVKVNKVDLNGVPGLASGVVAKLVQGSIDKKVNPLEILRAEQVSAVVPVQYANGALKLRATNMQPAVVGNALTVRIAFEFSKAQ